MRQHDSAKTWVEIDSDQLRVNIRLVKQAIGRHRSIVLVVKSDAYGHGAATVAALAAEEGINHFGVATLAEGIALRRTNVTGEIILLHPPLEFELDRALEADLSPSSSTHLWNSSWIAPWRRTSLRPFPVGKPHSW